MANKKKLFFGLLYTAVLIIGVIVWKSIAEQHLDNTPASTPAPTATPHTCPPIPPVVCPTVEYRGLPDVGRVLTTLDLVYLETGNAYEMVDEAFSSIPDPYQPELAAAANLMASAKLHAGEALAEIQFWDGLGYFFCDSCGPLDFCVSQLNVLSQKIDWLERHKDVSDSCYVSEATLQDAISERDFWYQVSEEFCRLDKSCAACLMRGGAYLKKCVSEADNVTRHEMEKWYFLIEQACRKNGDCYMCFVVEQNYIDDCFRRHVLGEQ